MSRFAIRTTVLAGILAMTSAAYGQQRQPVGGQAQPAYYAQPKKVIINPNQGGAPQPIGVGANEQVRVPAQTGYVQLHAPLYPSPKPNIPYQVGATYITNPALAPHEMLYPHRYRALYPPYYYRVNGQWKAMFGTMRRYEQWKLEGTEVNVEYCSKKPFLYRLGTLFSR